MKELHFEKVSGRGALYVAYEGAYRFTLHQTQRSGSWQVRWRAAVYARHSVRVSPLEEADFASRAEAIDWLARYRLPETERAGT